MSKLTDDKHNDLDVGLFEFSLMTHKGDDLNGGIFFPPVFLQLFVLSVFVSDESVMSLAPWTSLSTRLSLSEGNIPGTKLWFDHEHSISALSTLDDDMTSATGKVIEGAMLIDVVKLEM